MKGLRKLKDDGSLLSAKLPETILERLRKQKLGATNDKYWLDEVGDYRGKQHEKSVYNFDGTNGFVGTGVNNVGGAANMTIIILARKATAELAKFALSGFGTAGATNRQDFIITSNKMRLEISSGGITSTTIIEDTEFHYFAYRLAGSTLADVDFFLDGIKETISSINSLSINSGISEIKIGQSIVDSYDNFSGDIAEAIYYERALTDAEMLLVVNGNPPLDSKFHYLFEEQTGTTVFDISGNNNHGTVSGGVTHNDIRNLLLVNHTNKFGYSNGVNMLKYSEDFTVTSPGAGWYNQTVNGGNAVVVTNDYANDPNGNNTAKRLQASFSNTGGDDVSLVNQLLTTYISNQQVVFSIWIKSNTASNQTVLIRAGEEQNTFTATQTWQKVESLSNGVQNVQVNIGLRRFFTSSQTSLDILIWQPQLQAGSNSTPYQKTSANSNLNSIIPRLNTDLGINTVLKDIFNNELQFKGKVASDMKLVKSNCIELDGTNGSGVITDSSIINFNNDFELEVSFNSTRIGNFDTIICMYEDGDTRRVTVDQRDNGKIGIAIRDSNDDYFIQNTKKVLIDGKDHTVRYVANRTTDIMKIYVDGILDGEYSMHSINNDITNGNIYIGEFGTSLKYFKGKLWNIKIKSSVNSLQFPIAEGLGTTSYAKDDQTKQITWVGGATWSTQDSFHHNINEGFNDAPYFDGLTSKVVFDAWDLRNSTFRMKFLYNKNAPEGQIISLHDNSNSARMLNVTINSRVVSNNDLVVQIRDFNTTNLDTAAWNGLVLGEVYELIVKFDNTADAFVIKTLNGVASTSSSGASRLRDGQTDDTFHLGIRDVGGFPFDGIIFSCEAAGLHKWVGQSNWIDSIGNNDGVVTNPLYVKLPLKIGGVYSNPAASYEEGIKLLGNSYGIVSSNIVTGDLLSQDYFDFTCTAAKSSLRKTGSAQVIFSYRNSQTDLVQFFLGSTTGATAQYRANDNVLYTIDYTDLDNTVFVKYRVYLDVLNKTFSLYVNDVLFETIDLVIDAQTLTSSIFSIGRIFSGNNTGAGKFYGIIKDISISTAANSANFELKETADLIAYDKYSISKTITFVTVDWLYNRIAAISHNKAETKLSQAVFREDFGESTFHFDSYDLSSNTIDFNTVLNSSEVFVEENENSKTNVETFLPSGIVTIVNRKENDIYNNKNT